MSNKVASQLAVQIATYVEATEGFQRGTAGSFFNFEAQGKPGSSVPASAYLERFFDADTATGRDNLQAARHIEPVLTRLRSVSLGSLYEPFWTVERDPSALRRWKAGETERDRAMKRRFDALCLACAAMLLAGNPDLSLTVHRTPDKDGSSTAMASSPTGAANSDNWQSQRPMLARAHRLRYNALQEIEQREGDITRKAAMAMWSDEAHLSVPTIERAVRFVERGRWPNGEMATYEERYGIKQSVA